MGSRRDLSMAEMGVGLLMVNLFPWLHDSEAEGISLALHPLLGLIPPFSMGFSPFLSLRGWLNFHL